MNNKMSCRTNFYSACFNYSLSEKFNLSLTYTSLAKISLSLLVDFDFAVTHDFV